MKTIGYLCSEFPALSHTFISREISILEKEGFHIHTATINPSKHLEKMGSEDQARAECTYCVKRTPWVRIVAVFLAYFLRFPKFLAVFLYSLRLTWLAGPRSLLKSTAYFVEALLLDDWARRNTIRHVHVHFANPAATVALIASHFGRITFSLSVHGPDEFYDVERNNLREKIRGASFIRCIGFFCRSQLMRLSPQDQWRKFHVVRCGLYKDEFVPRRAAPSASRSILCVGRLCPSKGQAVFIDAARNLTAKGLDFQIVLLGGGEDLEKMRGLVQAEGLGDRILVEGPVERSRILEELARAVVFVLPSFAEGIPAVLMEAMAAGVPVVSTRIAGIPELIENGKEGFLVPASDVEGLCSVLEAFLRGEVDTGPLTANAVAKIKNEYDVEENTKKLGAIFDTLGVKP